MKRTPHPKLRQMLLRVLRVKVNGANQLSDKLEQGRVLIAANHVSYLDGVIVALASPTPLIFPVDTSFSRDGFFSRTFLNMLQWFGWGEIVPMDSTKPAALKTIKRKLDEGANVLIFPEGQVSVDGLPTNPMPGTDWLARQTGATRIELRIDGAEKSYLFGKSGRELWPAVSLTFTTGGRAEEPSWEPQGTACGRLSGTQTG